MRLRGVIAGAAIVVALAGGCTQKVGTAEDSSGFVAGDGSSVVLPPDERVVAPIITGTDLNGKPVDTATWKGRPGVINVWASWCSPCRVEAPELEAAAERNPKVHFLGLDTRDSDAAARAFIDKYGVSYPNLPDPDGQYVLAFADSLPPQAIPSTLLIDSEGRVAGRFLGAVTAGQLDAALKQLQETTGGAQ